MNCNYEELDVSLSHVFLYLNDEFTYNLGRSFAKLGECHPYYVTYHFTRDDGQSYYIGGTPTDNYSLPSWASHTQR